MTGELIRVLLVVRDPEAREELHQALNAADGFVVTRADAPADGAAALERGDHDLLIIELDQPDLPGLEDLALSRSRPNGRPVLALAASEARAGAIQAVRRGYADYLLKDHLDPPLVNRVVRYAVEAARAERRRLRTEHALMESEHRYRSLFEQSRDAIFMTERGGEILELNQAALDLLGYEEDELIGSDVLTVYADPVDRERFREEIEARGHVRDFEVRMRRGDGAELWCLLSAWVRREPGGEVAGYQGIIHDITGRKQVEEQLSHHAFHDTLTGLPNRALLMDRLDRAVARRRRGEERQLAVLFLDLDRFKIVNDSLGHVIGDELLAQIARLLETEVRDEDTVARIGGDEFAILLDGVDEPSDPTHVAERIQERLRKPFRLRGHDVFASMSIGITFGGGGVESPQDLLRNADTAMYRAKELGPARYQIFDEAMHAHAVTLLQLETDLRLALERHEFVVHYQPVMELATGALIGFEALVRWDHPARGLLAPQSFLPVAEDTGLIVPLSEWVLRTAARQLRAWHERIRGRGDLFMSVNVSARQVTEGELVAVVQEVLEETGLPPRCLRLELTESVIIRNPDAAIATLRRLRKLGVGLCIDDFGTGYSSLNYLHDFPVDTLKIDRSFVARMSERGDSHIVATIVALARNLGLESVAEGVETDEQLETLRTLGPASVQGFLFSSPLDERAAGALLDDALPAAKSRDQSAPRG